MNQDTLKLFDDISQFVTESRSLLAQGAMMELSGLDENVRMLCEKVLTLSQEDRIRHADRLQALLQELKLLGEEMVAKRDAITGEIVNISDHRKAHVAYKTADATDGFGKKKQDKQE